MQDFALVKAVVPKELKCLAFSALARRDEKFTHWLHRQMETLVVQARESEETHTNGQETPCGAGVARRG
jgi:hypothetical protein